MKKLFTSVIGLVLALVLLLPIAPASAATTNYSSAVPGIVPFTFFMDGQFTTTQTGVIKFNMPFKARLIGAQISCEAVTGTSPQNAVDIKDDGTTVLSATMDVTAADTVVEGTVSAPAIADESVMTVDFTITGTSPTFDDCVLILLVARV